MEGLKKSIPEWLIKDPSFRGWIFGCHENLVSSQQSTKLDNKANLNSGYETATTPNKLTKFDWEGILIGLSTLIEAQQHQSLTHH